MVTVVFRETNPVFSQAALTTHLANVAGLAAGQAVPPTPDNCKPLRHPQPILTDPAVYVDEYVGGQFAWSHADVTIDDVKINNGNMDDQGFHYTAVNRAFATERLRVTKYGRPMRGVAHSGERAVQARVQATEGRTERPAVTAAVVGAGGQPANQEVLAAQAERAYVPVVPRSVHPRLAEAMQVLSSDGPWETEPITFRLGFDGVSFFCWWVCLLVTGVFFPPP